MTDGKPGPDDDTLRTCFACGGNFRIGDHVCKWCSGGFMNAEQEAYWRAHKSGPRPKVTPDD